MATDADGATAQYGPAKLFSGQYPNAANDPTQSATSPPSGPLSVSTVGTTGPSGSVTSTASVTQGTQGTADPNQPRGIGPGPIVADAVSSTCTASNVGDNFKVVYNEQIPGADGSITVNAVHMSLLGPTAVGDLIIAQSVCGRGATTGGATTTGAGSTGGMATTGIEVLRMVLVALTLLVVGAQLWRHAPEPAVAAIRRRVMPWTRRSLFTGRRSGRRRPW
jgi:hypothetical protein